MTSVSHWLQLLGLEQYADEFENHDIDIDLLPQLDHDSLRELGVASLGHRLKLLQAINTGATDSAPHNSLAVSSDQHVIVDSPERRQLTVMFCDLVGSTALADRLDPEKYHEIIERYRRTVVTPVRFFNGFVAEYRGDGILAYFGYPEAHENDAAHALRAALQVIEAVENLKVGLEIRIGIATGLVVAGQTTTDESDARHEVLGSTANLAARLQTIAKPGTIIVGELTRRLTQSQFSFRSLGNQHLRGLPAPVEAFHLEKVSNSSDRHSEPVEQPLPLLGRNAIFDMLISKWDKARKGSGQVVLISGEPGIGKTRLVDELYHNLPSSERTTLRFFGSPLHRNSAFYPIIDHVQNLTNFYSTVSRAVNEESFGESFTDAVEDADKAATLFHLLLEAPVSGFEVPPESINEQHLDWIQRLARQVKNLSEKRPVLLVAEDAHWMDPTTVNVLSEVIRIVERLPVFMIITHRNEFSHRWNRYNYVKSVNLNRLKNNHCRELILQLAANQILEETLVEEIIDKSDGIPLFVEELTKWLIEPNETTSEYSFSRELSVPETLRDSLMARLDRLGSVKEVAQFASVIGRQFSIDMLASISDSEVDAIRHALNSLISVGLIESSTNAATSIFRFRHALIQEAAYNSLLISRREIAHLKIAELLQTNDLRLTDTEPALLAHHFEMGQRPSSAIEFRIRASRQARRQLALIESKEHIVIALRLLDSLERDESRDRLEVDLRIRLGRCWIPIKGYGAKEVWENYALARELTEKLNDNSRLSEILFGLAGCLHHQAKLRQAYEIGQQCLKHIGSTDDDISRMKICISQGMLRLHLAEIRHARPLLNEGFLISERRSHPRMRGIQQHGVIALAYGGLAEWLLGFPEKGYKKTQEAIALATELDSPYSLVYAICSDLCLMQADGPNSKYIEASDQALAVAREGKFSFWESLILYFRDWYLAVKEKNEDSVARMVLTQQHWQKGGMKFSQPHYHACLADAQKAVGQNDQAMDTLKIGLKLSEESHDRVFLADIHRHIGDITALPGTCASAQQALMHYRQSASIAEQFGQKIWQLRAFVRMVKIAEEERMRNSVLSALDGLHSSFTEGHSQPDVIAAGQLLSHYNNHLECKRHENKQIASTPIH